MSQLFSELYQPVAESVQQKARQIRLLICDVDGVFSDGRIYLGNQGEELKAFHTRDGYGVKALRQAGIEVAVNHRPHLKYCCQTYAISHCAACIPRPRRQNSCL